MKIFFKGFNYSQDGPGNRLVYHLQGCNMRCPWCANPEGMCFGGGQEYSAGQILDECLRSRAMFFSGGGVTFTGGEATGQMDELLKVCRMLKEVDIHTAIETNGTSGRLSELLPYIDYLMMDFKHHDGALHKQYTGVSLEPVKRNFERNCASGRQQHIRIPLINGINTQDPQGFADYFSGFDTGNTVFEFLAYHEYGKEKWKTPYQITDGFVPEETLGLFRETFEKHKLKLVAL